MSQSIEAALAYQAEKDIKDQMNDEIDREI